eukprot:scaffold153297_cov14-Tisochrysis_lutea.AAC.1
MSWPAKHKHNRTRESKIRESVLASFVARDKLLLQGAVQTPLAGNMCKQRPTRLGDCICSVGCFTSDSTTWHQLSVPMTPNKSVVEACTQAAVH